MGLFVGSTWVTIWGLHGLAGDKFFMPERFSDLWAIEVQIMSTEVLNNVQFQYKSCNPDIQYRCVMVIQLIVEKRRISCNQG